MEIKVSFKQTVSSVFKVYVNNTLHLFIRQKELNGFESWIETENKFVIQFNFKNGEVMLSEYDNKNIWQEILKNLDNII